MQSGQNIVQGFEIYNEKQKIACLFPTNDLLIKLFLFLRAIFILHHLVFIYLFIIIILFIYYYSLSLILSIL